MTPEPILDGSHVISELVEFIGTLLAVGAVGFRFAVLPGAKPAGGGGEPEALARAARVAAAIGLAGALIGLWHLAGALPQAAARRHVAVGELLRTTPVALIWVIGSVAAAAGLAAAVLRVPGGWVLAGAGVAAALLRNLASGSIERLAKPVHVLAAGLWIGTLFVLVVAGIPAVLAAGADSSRRGALVAAMVNSFSPLALGSAAVLGGLGAFLSWRELGTLAALATPYGRALLLKLVLVASVLGLGALNWRRQKPRLGTEAAARSLLGTAGAELTVALLVLVATAVMVSLPAPR